MSIRATVTYKSFAAIVDETVQSASDSDAIKIGHIANYIHMSMVSLSTDPDFLNRIMSDSFNFSESFVIQHYKGQPGVLNGFVLNGSRLGGNPQSVTLVT